MLAVVLSVGFPVKYANRATVETDRVDLMKAMWGESFFDVQPEQPTIYWVCFWTNIDDDLVVRHDPQRIKGATSVEETLALVHGSNGERGCALFVETTSYSESREHGWRTFTNPIRLSGDFRPPGTTVTTSGRLQR